jgi:hypothetical protein
VELEVIDGTLEERPTPKPMFLPVSAAVQALMITRSRKRG